MIQLIEALSYVAPVLAWGLALRLCYEFLALAIGVMLTWENYPNRR